MYKKFIMYKIFIMYTGSSRKNDKSKTVFTSLIFCKSSVFSAVLGQELAANSSSRAYRSITITWWHPQKLTPPICFQALVGCLRPTTYSETLSKEEFSFVTVNSMNHYPTHSSNPRFPHHHILDYQDNCHNQHGNQSGPTSQTVAVVFITLLFP